MVLDIYLAERDGARRHSSWIRFGTEPVVE